MNYILYLVILTVIPLLVGFYGRALFVHIYQRIYGVRGGLKPPIGPSFGQPKPIGYRIRYFLWKINAALYRHTGLPNRWEESFSQRDSLCAYCYAPITAGETRCRVCLEKVNET